MKTESQAARILKWMQEKGPITPKDAEAAFGCMRLAARINDLRRKGYKIESSTRKYKDNEGRTVKYAAYSITKEEMCEDG